jgi:hypothetical protein
MESDYLGCERDTVELGVAQSYEDSCQVDWSQMYMLSTLQDQMLEKLRSFGVATRENRQVLDSNSLAGNHSVEAEDCRNSIEEL